MSERPFQCSKCGNWKTPLPLDADDECPDCVMESHAVHPRTGTYDCHYRHSTATHSEKRMAKNLINLEFAVQTIKNSQSLVEAEVALSDAERIERDVPEALTWSDVFELPGLRGANPSARFKSYNAMQDLVYNKRRPESDLTVLERSRRLCEEMAQDVPILMAEARTAMIGMRNPDTKSPPKSERSPEEQEKINSRMARARAGRKSRKVLTTA